eukprot:2996672-Pleurochrysis_carterae.AAC.8
MNGAEAAMIHRARELIVEGPVTFAEHMIDCGMDTRQQTRGYTWKELLKYAQRGDRGRSTKENARIDERRKEASIREAYPTLYPGEVEGDKATCMEPGCQRRNMRGLTDRAKANQHRRKRKGETHQNKRMRLTKTNMVQGGSRNNLNKNQEGGNGSCHHINQT